MELGWCFITWKLEQLRNGCMSMIEIKNLTKCYGETIAVNNLSLSIEKGRIFSFLGMNGAGKTTTLRMLVGVLRQTKGEIFINGVNSRQDPISVKQIIGYIPDRPYLYAKLSGVEYLQFVGDLYGMAQSDIESRSEFLLEHYQLSGARDRLIESYSHGMKQRLATCGALLHSPQVLIVDEPMVGLDPHGARLLKQSLREYAERGMTVFLSTHSLNVAEEVSDLVGVIHRGELIFQGTVDEIRGEVQGGSDQSLEELFLEITRVR